MVNQWYAFSLKENGPKNTNYESIISSTHSGFGFSKISHDLNSSPATAVHLVLRTAAAVETLRKARPRRQVANSKAKIWYPLVPGTLGTLW